MFETPELDREIREEQEYQAKEELTEAFKECWDIMREEYVDYITAMEIYIERKEHV